MNQLVFFDRCMLIVLHSEKGVISKVTDTSIKLAIMDS